MTTSYAAPVLEFLAADSEPLVARLALADAQRFRGNEPQQVRAWTVTIATLKAALATVPEAADWQVILEFAMRRLGRRIDVVLVTPRAVLVLEFKVQAERHLLADRRQVEDYALDLQDFHAGSRIVPIVPILVATDAPSGTGAWPLLLPGTAAEVLDTNSADLGALLSALWRRLPDQADFVVTAWQNAAYRPVPGIVDAACTLYSRHGVDDIESARADATNLTTTRTAIQQAVARARSESLHLALFVTGIPGAGKTLCGLDAVYGAGRDTGAVFLTGNPTLVHVLREALARDAASGDRTQIRAARQRTKVSIQALPAFRDHHVRDQTAPPEHVAVIDEAQRAWALGHAVRKSRDREVQLTDSEPGHLLEIMGRHPDWAVVICLIGQGQEIHDGEGGLAEWGAALAAQPKWQMIAAPATLVAQEPRQRLPALPGLLQETALHLDVPMRSLRSDTASAWVDAVLRGDVDAASNLVQARGPVPFVLTRSLAAMRAHLRHAGRGLRRSGLVASSGARRLRAEGLGAELDHMDAGSVARWFLDRWPEDVRASDALEQVATEFSCQGLELDHVGLCWGGDLVRSGPGWRVRDFIGTRWTIPRGTEAIANRINTYRVLLTRARYETLIWIPLGSPDDPTRPPDEMTAVADFLAACGAADLPQPAPLAPFEPCEPLLL